MPKNTFYKLEAVKKKKITEAFLREFSIKAFDDASITSVVKSLGIAKGSIYQYFENKLDLFLYLSHESAGVKMKYVGDIKRENYSDFWSFFRSLYESGITFDKENHQYSHFLHCIEKNINSPSIKELRDQWLDQIVAHFNQLVQFEVDAGAFRTDIPVKTMGFYLYKASISIHDYVGLFHGVNPQESIEKGEAVYANGKHNKLLETVDHYIQILKPSLEKSSL